MSKFGLKETRTGRIVYNRKPHMFSQRDAARVTRQALNFLPWKHVVWTGYGLSLMDEYAIAHFQVFCNYAGRWNFFPRSMLEEGGNESPVEDYAASLALRVAGYLGVPDLAVDLASMLYSEFISGTYSQSMRIKPLFASSIIQAVNNNTMREEEIYGHKETR